MGSNITSGASCDPFQHATTTSDLFDRSRDDAVQAPGTPVAIAHIDNRRVNHHRRMVYDRRRLIRFDPDRRVFAERRSGVEAWAIP